MNRMHNFYIILYSTVKIHFTLKLQAKCFGMQYKLYTLRVNTWQEHG